MSNRDKSRDDKFLNCQTDYETDYVAGLYTDHQKVRNFLKEKCADGTIKYSTHKEIYLLIEKELGFKIPV